MRTGLLMLLLFFVSASVAQAEEQTSSQGAVTATLSFEFYEDDYSYSDLWLTIERGGQVLYDEEPSTEGCGDYECMPGGGRADSVRVRDLDGDGEPEILLDLYSGGAHCCYIGRVYSFDGTGYRETTRNFADPGYRLSDVDDDGTPELMSGDARFAYRFASFAGSVFPVRIWSYRDGRFSDVTDEHPARIRADVKRTWRLFRQAVRKDYETRGRIAAWAANKYRLGQRKSALRTLRRLGRRGQLKGYPGSATAFIRDLDGFLRRLDYT